MNNMYEFPSIIDDSVGVHIIPFRSNNASLFRMLEHLVSKYLTNLSTIKTQQPRNTAHLLLMALQALQFPKLNRKVHPANEEPGIQHLAIQSRTDSWLTKIVCR